MRRVRLLVLGLLGASLVACQGAGIPPGAGVATEGIRSESVVSIYTFGSGRRGSRLQGTGFFIAPDLVVTNFHVIEGASAATLRFPDGRDRRVDAVVGDDVDADLVLLRAPGDGPPPLALAPALPEVGSPVRAIGTPDGEAQSVVVSNIGSRLVTFDVLDEAVMVTASIRPGMSGAPVLDDAGRVVGVLSRGTNVEDQSYMVPASRIESIGRFDPVPVASWSHAKRREPGALGRARFGEATRVFESGAYERAVQLLELALDAGLSSAGQATAWYVIGDAYANLGRDEDALGAYRQAIALEPRHALSYAAMGAVFRRQRRFDDAVRRYRQALDLMPASSSFHTGYGWALVQMHASVDAYDAFRRALQIQPRNASAWTGAAAACLELGRAEEARLYAERATDLRPDVPQTYWILASAHTRLKAWPQAVEVLERGLVIAPGHARAMFDLGRAYLMLGNRDQAEAQRRRLRAADPELAARLAALIKEA